MSDIDDALNATEARLIAGDKTVILAIRDLQLQADSMTGDQQVQLAIQIQQAVMLLYGTPIQVDPDNIPDPMPLPGDDDDT